VNDLAFERLQSFNRRPLIVIEPTARPDDHVGLVSELFTRDKIFDVDLPAYPVSSTDSRIAVVEVTNHVDESLSQTHLITLC
jgi:hypothetical protein